MEFDNQRPIWIQITEGIRQKIVSGQYGPGEKLPSVRDFALMLQVNPNTVVKALARLEQEGLVTTRRGAGKYVAEDTGLFTRTARQEARQLTDRYLEDMKHLGFAPADIRALLEERGIK